MSIIKDLFQKAPLPGSEPTREELVGHHCYRNELFADGFVSPIALPCDRLRELMGDMSVEEMAARCRLTTRELQLLLETEYLEPSVRQLNLISLTQRVSVFWLLGYHTAKDAIFTKGDREIMDIIGKRSAAEAQLFRIKEKGVMRDILVSVMERRINKLNRLVASTAAHIVAEEHLPLSDNELFMLSGRPVYIEHADGNNEWGLVLTDGNIKTATADLAIEEAGTSFQAYQTPDCRVHLT